MFERLAPLILLSTFTVIQTKDDADQMSLTVVKPGSNFNLTCSVNKTESGLFYWYRLSFGSTVQTIAQGSYETINLKGKFNNPRFRVRKVDTMYSLQIFNVTKEDEASYFCQAGSSYKMTFFNASLLTVVDQRNHTVYVEQTPTASVPPGGSALFHCSLLSKNNKPVQCPPKNNVYWFRAGSAESPPSLLYTYDDQIDENHKNKCVYSLSKTVRNASDTGTYYCAVATCGDILFGEGTRVETRLDMLGPVCVALGLLLLCSVVINVVMFCRNRKDDRKAEASNQIELVDRLIEDQANNEDGHVASLNYVALDFPLRKAKRSKNKNELVQECLYSATRDCR